MKRSPSSRPKGARSFPGALGQAPHLDQAVKITVTLPGGLVNELRNAVIYRQGQGRRVSMKSLIEDAVRPALEGLRVEIGGPIPQRPAEYEHLMTGRPPGAAEHP